MSTPERQNQAPFELRAFIDSIPALAWTALPDGSIECFNQKFTDYSGWSPLQIPQAWRSRGELHPDDLERFDGWWQEILESRKPAPTEVRFRRAEGEYRWFQISAAPIHDAQGNLVRWCGINIDIDDRKRAEQKLQANELSLRQIIDNIPGYVHTTSAAGDVEFHNRQTLEYFGKTKEELEDWRRNDIVHPGDLPRVIEAWRKSVETGQNYDVEQRNRRADGVYRWFQARGRPVRNAEGEITAMVLASYRHRGPETR